MQARAEPETKTLERPEEWNVIETAGENVLERFREDLRDIELDLELFENRVGNLVTPTMPRLPMLLRKGYLTPLDIEDTKTSYNVRMNLPGVPKDLIEVHFLDQTLEIEAESKVIKESESKKFVLHERRDVQHHRRVDFPSPIAPEKAEAKLDHGVLTVVVPKLKPAKELRVHVE
jgi:HSP20 family protein